MRAYPILLGIACADGTFARASLIRSGSARGRRALAEPRCGTRARARTLCARARRGVREGGRQGERASARAAPCSRSRARVGGARAVSRPRRRATFAAGGGLRRRDERAPRPRNSRGATPSAERARTTAASPPRAAAPPPPPPRARRREFPGDDPRGGLRGRFRACHATHFAYARARGACADATVVMVTGGEGAEEALAFGVDKGLVERRRRRGPPGARGRRFRRRARGGAGAGGRRKSRKSRKSRKGPRRRKLRKSRRRVGEEPPEEVGAPRSRAEEEEARRRVGAGDASASGPRRILSRRGVLVRPRGSSPPDAPRLAPRRSRSRFCFVARKIKPARRRSLSADDCARPLRVGSRVRTVHARRSTAAASRAVPKMPGGMRDASRATGTQLCVLSAEIVEGDAGDEGGGASETTATGTACRPGGVSRVRSSPSRASAGARTAASAERAYDSALGARASRRSSRVCVGRRGRRAGATLADAAGGARPRGTTRFPTTRRVSSPAMTRGGGCRGWWRTRRRARRRGRFTWAGRMRETRGRSARRSCMRGAGSSRNHPRGEAHPGAATRPSRRMIAYARRAAGRGRPRCTFATLRTLRAAAQGGAGGADATRRRDERR